jgi:hypothetical protein
MKTDMKTIYKYEIPAPMPLAVVQMPLGARILSVQMQHDKPVAWAIVDTCESKLVNRTFVLVNTGADISGSANLESAEFLTTLQFFGGDIVKHLFEVK